MNIVMYVQQHHTVKVDGIQYQLSEDRTKVLKDKEEIEFSKFASETAGKDFSVLEGKTWRFIDIRDPEYLKEFDAYVRATHVTAELSEKQAQVQEMLQYLKDTDYKLSPDYDKVDDLEDIKLKRQTARDFIRKYQVS